MIDFCICLEPGVWLLASLNSHETTKGMRVKFQDVECFRDYQYEYDFEVNTPNKEFTVWKPPTLDDIKKEDELLNTKKANVEVDVYTDLFAQELGLRTLKNQSHDSGVEKLDLSFLDYDAIDVNDGDVDINLTFNDTMNKTESSSKPNTQNGTKFSHWTEMDSLNLTNIHSNNQSTGDNSNNVLRKIEPSISGNSSLHQRENTTISSHQNVLLKNGSLTTNASVSVVASSLDNVTLSVSKNTTVHNTTGSSVIGNASADVSVAITLSEDSEERLTRGDVFSHDLPLSTPSNNSLNSTLNSEALDATLLQSTREDEKNVTKRPFDISGVEANLSVSIAPLDLEQFNLSSSERHNLTLSKLLVENTDNKDNNSLNTTAQLEYGLQKNNSEVLTVVANSSLENSTPVSLKTGPLQNATVDASRSDPSGGSGTEANVTTLFSMLSNTSVESMLSEIILPTNLSLSGDAVKPISSEELDASEEVFIYLQENNTEVIKSSSFKPPGHNWTYDGTHYTVPEDIPNDIKKYFENETPQTTVPPKKTKTVTFRQRPMKGHGMKTRKKMEYKPQARSGLPFSPRGFNPGVTPRGSRPLVPQPIPDDEDLINMPVVIGVPRPDFSDYQLYIPGEDPDHLEVDDQNVTQDEYEYVMYKDPYSDHKDVKSLNLDETALYYLKLSGPNVKTYFIAAEEVEWDYGGYGPR